MEDGMNEFSEIFGTDLTVEILGVSSILLLLLYGAGVSLLQRWKTTAQWIPAVQRHVISGLGAALVAVAVGLGLHAANVTIASARTQSGTVNSISPQDLHRSVDMKSLPVQHFEDQTFVFPSRRK
jgi:hypothetical protein